MSLSPEQEARLAELESRENGLSPEQEARLAELEAKESGSSPSIKDLALGPGLQGGTFGYADEINAGIQSRGERAQPVLDYFGITDPNLTAAAKLIYGWGSVSPFMGKNNPQYYAERDAERAHLAEVRQESPKAAMGFEIGGTMANPLSYITPGKGWSMAKKAAAFAVPGAVYGYGGTNREGSGALFDTALGGTLSAIFGVGGDKVTSFLERLPQIRNRLGMKAMGASEKAIKMDEKLGTQMGQEALDRGLLQLGQSTDVSLAKAEDILQGGKEAMSDVFTAADATGKNAFNPVRVASELEDQLKPEYLTPNTAAQHKALSKNIDSLLARGLDDIPLSEAQGIEQELRNIAYPGGKRPLEPNARQLLAQQSEAIVSDEMNKAAESVLGKTAPLEAAKKQYQVGRTTSDLLRDKLAKETAHKLTLSDAWNVPLNMVLGPKIQAATLNTSVVKVALEKFPQMLGKYAGPFAQAYQAGPAAVEALHQNLMGDPEYVAMTNQVYMQLKSDPMTRTTMRQSIDSDPLLSPIDKAKQLSDLNSGNF